MKVRIPKATRCFANDGNTVLDVPAGVYEVWTHWTGTGRVRLYLDDEVCAVCALHADEVGEITRARRLL